MMGIGFSELLVILVIIMIIFGAGKLPEIGSAFGKSIKNFKQSMKEAESEDQQQASTATATEAPQQAAQQSQQQTAPAQQRELTDEEKEKIIREKAQAAGAAKDKAMRDMADAFTASLPRSGSYDYSKDNKKV